VLDTLHFQVLPLKSPNGVVNYWTSGWGRIIFPNLPSSVTAAIDELE
jgi:hypothetical protein